MSKRKSTPVNKVNKESVKIIAHEIPAHTVGPFHNSSFFRQYWKQSIVIVLLSFGLYHACIPYNYVLDDQMVITGNSFTKKGFSGIWDILTTESFTGYFGEKKDLVQGNRYRPLSIITFAIEYGITGDLNPALSHFVNILLYALTGILLMMVLQMLFRNFRPKWSMMAIPFLASLFFITHPIHTEAVANIKGRDEIMCMLFSLAALYAALRYTDTNSKRWLTGSMIGYFLALLSKENAITFVAVIPLTVYFFSQSNRKKINTLLLWLIITTIFYLILRFNTAGVPKFDHEITDLMNNPFLGMKGTEKFGTIMYTLGKYIMLLIFPHPLSHDYYPYAIPKVPIFNIWAILSLTLYLYLIYLGLKGLGKKSVFSYTILFYLTTLTIVSNIVINLGTFMNERFIFMASAGFCVALAYFLAEHLPKISLNYGFKAGLVLSAVILIGYCAKTYDRVPVWKDALSLNQAAVDVSSNSARANSFMSTALFEEYKITKEREVKISLLDKAEIYGKKAVEIMPDYSNANLMLVGVVSERYKMGNDINSYVKDMKPIVLRRPDIPFIKEFSEYLRDRGHNEVLFPFYFSIGQELMGFKDKRRDWSVQYLNYAYSIYPNHKGLNEALSRAYDLSGNVNEANRFRIAAQNLQ
ncbi:MAG: glycosyltransferase family 39 protein [Saprospiraceae bacterium]|nr:glycosyltransferase family 39 protein [Saprospiraceae bacterium]